MKKLLHQLPHWPKMHEQLSALCQFWGNTTWREHVATCLRGRIPNVERRLKRPFMASLVKWRYETAADVLAQLAPLRDICEHGITAEMFQNTQERALIDEVLGACRDENLWKLIVTMHTWVMGPLGGMRRWGMVCNCSKHRDMRHAGKKAFCSKASRRLHEAADFIEKQRAELDQWIIDFTDEKACGSHYACTLVRGLLVQARALLKTWFHYLSLVPWAFACADTPAGAQNWLDQIQSKPLQEHDPLTQLLANEFLDDLKALAAGGPCAEALAAEVKLLQTAPLDESAGEGYHRGTTQEIQRAAASTTATLKRRSREKQNRRLARWFMKKYKRRGKQIVRFEWRTHHRLLQARRRSRWVPRKMTPHQFWKRMYSEDDKSRDNWNGIVGRMPPPPKPAPAEEAYNLEGLQKEWLSAALVPNNHYSVEDTVHQPTPDGGVEAVPRTQHFTVISTASGSSRPHNMPTHESGVDPMRTARLAVQVQMYEDVKDAVGSPPAGAKLVHRDGEDDWVPITRISTFDVFLIIATGSNEWRPRPSILRVLCGHSQSRRNHWCL